MTEEKRQEHLGHLIKNLVTKSKEVSGIDFVPYIVFRVNVEAIQDLRVFGPWKSIAELNGVIGTQIQKLLNED